MEGHFDKLIPKNSSKKAKIFGVLSLTVIFGVFALFHSYNPRYSSNSSVAQFQLLEQEFQEYAQKYSKNYPTDDEYQKRLLIYLENASYIRAYNQLGNTFTLGVNYFTDLTNQEFKKLYTPISNMINRNVHTEIIESVEIATNVDWRTKGAVTNVKTQGPCGSYYAFAATGSIESAWFIAGNSLVSLSEQEIVDCSTPYGNNQCAGGITDAAFNFVIDNGITSESNYPYLAKNETCNTQKSAKVVARITKYQGVRANNPSALIAAVSKQPVAVAVEADQYVWQHYSSGVVNKDCGNNLDHGVVIVGYKNEGTNPYWIVKNSWGPDWGEKGYIRIGISSGNGYCGINMVPSFPVV